MYNFQAKRLSICGAVSGQYLPPETDHPAPFPESFYREKEGGTDGWKQQDKINNIQKGINIIQYVENIYNSDSSLHSEKSLPVLPAGSNGRQHMNAL